MKVFPPVAYCYLLKAAVFSIVPWAGDWVFKMSLRGNIPVSNCNRHWQIYSKEIPNSNININQPHKVLFFSYDGYCPYFIYLFLLKKEDISYNKIVWIYFQFENTFIFSCGYVGRSVHSRGGACGGQRYPVLLELELGVVMSHLKRC